MVDLQAIAAYEPKWPGVRELNFADQWRARWNSESELPDGAPVFHAYAMVVMGDKGYATREKGGDRWGLVEGPVGDMAAEAFVKSAAKERTGATIAKAELIGFFECKATRHNKEFEQGSITVRPLYLLIAKKVDDLPANSGFERRRFPFNEYMVAMRARHAELEEYLAMGANRYGVMRAKGEA